MYVTPPITSKRAANSRRYYVKHREQILMQRGKEREQQQNGTKLRRVERQARINTIKDVPCMDCGGRFPPYVMDFDHKREKFATVAFLVNKGFSWEMIQEEIDKCEIVCSNCHRIRTHTRKEREKHRSELSGYQMGHEA